MFYFKNMLKYIHIYIHIGDKLSKNVIRFGHATLVLKSFLDFTNYEIFPRQLRLEHWLFMFKKKRTATLGRRQPRDRGLSTFGRSKFMLPKLMSEAHRMGCSNYFFQKQPIKLLPRIFVIPYLRTFNNRLFIHFFQKILLCFDTFLYAKRAGHFKNGLSIGVSLLVLKL